jgi:hypothetical protein
MKIKDTKLMILFEMYFFIFINAGQTHHNFATIQPEDKKVFSRH